MAELPQLYPTERLAGNGSVNLTCDTFISLLARPSLSFTLIVSALLTRRVETNLTVRFTGLARSYRLMEFACPQIEVLSWNPRTQCTSHSRRRLTFTLYKEDSLSTTYLNAHTSILDLSSPCEDPKASREDSNASISSTQPWLRGWRRGCSRPGFHPSGHAHGWLDDSINALTRCRSAQPAPIPQQVCLPFFAFPNCLFKATLIQQQYSEEPSGSKFLSSFV